jgi:hypothetical protein
VSRYRYRLLGLVLAILMAAIGLGSCAPASRPTPSVILYGDSLAQQAAPTFNFFAQVSHRVSVTNRVFVGSAPCDWISRATQDAAALKPEAVVLMFAGSTLSPCMAGYNASSAPVAVTLKYERDLRTLAAQFGGQTKLYIEQIPARPPTMSDLQTEVADLNTMYRTLGMSVENAAADVENPDGSWAQALPCWSIEKVCGTAGPGKNTVRAPLPDGFHLCPYVSSGTCATYSSGAVRFGLGMEGPVGRDLHL